MHIIYLAIQPSSSVCVCVCVCYQVLVQDVLDALDCDPYLSDPRLAADGFLKLGGQPLAKGGKEKEKEKKTKEKKKKEKTSVSEVTSGSAPSEQKRAVINLNTGGDAEQQEAVTTTGSNSRNSKRKFDSL